MTAKSDFAKIRQAGIDEPGPDRSESLPPRPSAASHASAKCRMPPSEQLAVGVGSGHLKGVGDRREIGLGHAHDSDNANPGRRRALARGRRLR
jgi:hypothetical protein